MNVTAYQLTSTAAELFNKMIKRRKVVVSPYAIISVRYNRTYYIRGPSIEFDYLEGKPSTMYDNIIIVSFQDDCIQIGASMELMEDLDRKWDHYVQFEYINPKAFDRAIKLVKRIIEHHGVLCDNKQEDYHEWYMNMRRQGKLMMPDIEDLPPDHCDNYDGRT